MKVIKTVEDWLGKGNQLGIDIWKNKYRYNNETFEEWLDRISGKDEELKQLIIDKKFLFGGRILANRGLDKLNKKITLSNCYVLPQPEDNIESIFDTAKHLARTFSYGGGVGMDISNLAPRGTKVNNTAKETTGSVSFMDLYSLITELIGQSGRRGALMISISCEHPDLEEFITVKSDLNKVTKANISVRMTKNFMNAVKENKDITLTFTRPETNDTISKIINAKELFMKLAEMNWDYAEPGILFWDRIEEYNLMSNTKEFKYVGVNPCAEEPLPAGGSCLLGSINLSEFVDDPFTDQASFNLPEFNKTVKIATKALNDVMEEGLMLHPLEIQQNTVDKWKQIGLGIFGLADMLIKMGYTYGDKGSLKLCDIIGFNLADSAILTSSIIAKEKGNFGEHKEIAYTNFFINNTYKDTIESFEKYGLRNSQLLTIAPTGSLSSMLGVSGGIEPIFANSYTRKTESLHNKDEYYKVYTPIVKQYMEIHNIKNEEDLPPYFITSQQINYKDRIDMQSIWQSHIDASISSTVNVPNDFSIEDTFNMYLYAYDKGLKGLTMFRDGCSRLGILTTDNKETKQDKEKNEDTNQSTKTKLGRGYLLDVSDDLLSAKRTIVSGCGKFYLHVDFDEITGEPLETFIDIGSGGGCERNLQFISRLISLALRSGVPIESIIDQAKSVKPCNSYCRRSDKNGDTSKGTSCPSAIGYALEDLNNKIQDRCFADDIEDDEDGLEEVYIEKIEQIEKVASKNITDKNSLCPECSEPLIFEGGCNCCKSCGWTKCE